MFFGDRYGICYDQLRLIFNQMKTHPTGQCFCKPGWKGFLCDRPCDPNTYGEGCALNCDCNNLGECNHITGKNSSYHFIQQFNKKNFHILQVNVIANRVSMETSVKKNVINGILATIVPSSVFVTRAERTTAIQ